MWKDGWMVKLQAIYITHVSIRVCTHVDPHTHTHTNGVYSVLMTHQKIIKKSRA